MSQVSDEEALCLKKCTTCKKIEESVLPLKIDAMDSEFSGMAQLDFGGVEVKAPLAFKFEFRGIKK